MIKDRFPRPIQIAPLLALGAAVLGLTTGLTAQASSHREAPFITEQPKVDGTDWYMFKSYEPGREGYVTFVANYLPLQDPYGGPNYFFLDPDALYEMHIDSTGDGQEDVTYQFRFQNTLKSLAVPAGDQQNPVPLVNIGPISAADTANLNIIENYSVKVVRGDRRLGFSTAQDVTNAVAGVVPAGSNVFEKPLDYIGARSIPDYAAYAAARMYTVNLPGCTVDATTQGRMFVGQRKDPFVINLGEIFDLVNTDPLGPRDAEADVLADKNVTSLILEVPISCITAGGDGSGVIGSWTTASLRQGRILNPTPDFVTPAREGGAYTQVSRLGIPLVNEVVIGLPDKNRFNSSKPKDDAQFLKYVTNPTLPVLIQTLFNVPAAPTPRNDLVAAFLTGVPGVNQPVGLDANGDGTPDGVAPSEMLRLNTALPATAKGAQNSLGAAQCFVNGTLTLTNPGCDPAGFPNGRRPGDDVVDIELRVAEGFLVPNFAPGQSPFTDGALVNDSFFDGTFPYLRTPIPGSPNGVADGPPTVTP